VSGPRGALGLPEPDGAVPFVLVGAPGLDGQAPLAAGLMVGGKGLRDVDGGTLPLNDAQSHFDAVLGHPGIKAVPIHLVLGLGLRALDSSDAPQAWAAVWSSLSEGVRNTAQITDPLRGLPSQLKQDELAVPSALLHPEGPAMLGVAAPIVEDIVPQLLDTVAGVDFEDGMTAPQRIAAFITQAADDVLDKPTRSAWSLALDALALNAKLHGDVALAKSARHTSLAISGGYFGSEVPFVRVWVERGLRLMVESARAMSGPGPVGPRIAAAKEALERG